MRYSLFFLKFREYLQIILLWVIAVFFFALTAYSMAGYFYFRVHGVTLLDFLRLQLFGVLFIGFFIGTILFLLQEFVYPYLFRSYGILFTAVLRSLLFFITCFVGLFIVIQLNNTNFLINHNIFVLQIENLWIFCFMFYCLTVHVLITLFLVFRRRMGEKYFGSILTGHYLVPVVEYRIFMFLDMYSSTAAAEEAGHYTYSLLLQECFSDLSDLLPKYNAEVYQYVGDEAVLTWKISQGFDRAKCIAIYEDFCTKIDNKKGFYQCKYGIVPKFKASVNEGLVTVAEVGRIKTEIAYHGIVLSTAARVRDLCSSFNTDFLITSSFYEQLPVKSMKNFKIADTIFLRGKKKAVTIFMRAD
ncbi:adenylate/guanylate cyclase domain-containing protein [Flavobacterium aquicola]|uniref:Adenylate cyclase n=1 Tax=Flavobacterium aquicola TaxID=1682742 RepID=A0A3E0ENY5_9FLAO|nr:adenylate/guanylate cyclase domain-containing protein [Flavobacterium aquicola]REG99453.1 adenylate cyclase [Flavobacterium aquicola]